MTENDPSSPPPIPAYQPPAGTSDPAADPALRAKAVERLEAVKGFRIHLTVYLAVIGFLTAIWVVSGGGFFWPIWPALGWGLGLALHLASLTWDKEPTEAQIDAEARRLGQRGKGRPGAIED
jgi:hypothetical protein